jgi:RimJ/RimL family protein N-acetyltransferase
MTTPEPSDQPVNGRAAEDRTLILRDGSCLAIRPMGADDEERLLRFHHRLSRETIRRRFFAIHPELSEAELHRFTHVDHVDREAIVALADHEIVAVARFDRIGRGASAEVAFVVADDWQGRGLVTVLLTRLARRAGQVGIEQFVAETLPENRAMLTVFRHAGLPTTERFDRGVVHVTIDLSRRTSEPGT